MPIYCYQCVSCQHEFEEIQSFSAPETMKCPKCGKKKAQRVIRPCGGIEFKGSGFYTTDYKNKSEK
ncbi:MAG: zinc ribbon domain-containing protein [Planctomycetaceae bacterium]|nr:zinc ribbon domain-containing protein [Planctomycetaceae bacterium]MBQ2822166.1 zinc ribbon domain-containing protein [Thermoguttaceae bacterium]MDO4424239.1 zinc ribbon domain-containing protein [Planctomycetia bacterium]